jgi:hypothetical protein
MDKNASHRVQPPYEQGSVLPGQNDRHQHWSRNKKHACTFVADRRGGNRHPPSDTPAQSFVRTGRRSRGDIGGGSQG